MDVQTYIHGVGRRARAAARVIARADTATKNRALKEIAAAIERDSKRLLEANARDVEEAKRRKLDSAMIDRLTLTPKGIAAMADGLRQIAALPDPDRQNDRVEETPFRHQGGQDARAARRGRHHLRIPPQRDGGRRGPVRQVRQRGDPARRLGSDPIQPGDRRLRARGTQERRAAGGRGAGDRDHRPRRGGRADHDAGLRRRDRAARGQEPDRAPDARVAHPHDQAPARRVPHLHRRQGRPRRRRSASPTTPRPSGSAPAIPWKRCSSRAASRRRCCRRSARSTSGRASSCAATRRRAGSCPR